MLAKTAVVIFAGCENRHHQSWLRRTSQGSCSLLGPLGVTGAACWELDAGRPAEADPCCLSLRHCRGSDMIPECSPHVEVAAAYLRCFAVGY